MEAFILALIMLIGLCFCVEVVLSKPDVAQIAAGFVPGSLTQEQLFVAIGILGATVMPHNLYLHSALVQSRDVRRSKDAVREACRFNFIDSMVGLNGAFIVNAAILIVAAAAFWSQGIVVEELQQAHAMLAKTLGSSVAPYAFALALLCAGQSSTVTGTLAGQITMEGFLQFRMRPWLRRLITRLMAIAPAAIVILTVGDRGVYKLLIASQVVLSVQLSFAVVPLVKFTSSKRKMGPFVNPRWLQAVAWGVTVAIIGLNAVLVFDEIHGWIIAAGTWSWLVGISVLPVALGLGAFLAWLVFQRERPETPGGEVSGESIAAKAVGLQKQFKRIAVALEARATDSAMLAEAIVLAKAYKAELVLVHIVEGVGGQWYGRQTGDAESREDQRYIEELAAQLRIDLVPQGIPAVYAVLGYGDVPGQIVAIGQQQKVDLVVLGGHGHRGVMDWLYGQTIPGVRHGLGIPMMTIR
jgi:manganese transport protein